MAVYSSIETLSLACTFFFSIILLCSGHFLPSTSGQWVCSPQSALCLSAINVWRAAGLCVCLTRGRAELYTHRAERSQRTGWSSPSPLSLANLPAGLCPEVCGDASVFFCFWATVKQSENYILFVWFVALFSSAVFALFCHSPLSAQNICNWNNCMLKV